MTDEQLIERIARGDAAAFRQLMERHVPRLSLLARRMLADASEADDVIQEVFLKLWSGIAQWRADGGARVGTWLYRIVFNAAIDRKRRRQHDSLDAAELLPDDTPNGLDVASGASVRRLLDGLMNHLPDRQREALMLHYYGDLSAREAAEITGQSLTSFEALLFRGRQALRLALSQQGLTRRGDVA